MRRITGILLALATMAAGARLFAPLLTNAPAHTPPAAQTPAATASADLIPSAQAAAEIPPPPAAPTSDAPLDDKALLALRERQKALEARAQRLEARAQRVQQAETALEARIKQLEQIEAAIRQRLDEEASIKNKKIKRLAAVYAAMKPERAAPVVARMELGTVVRIFLLMDEKRVGKILSFLPPEKAVRISQALTRNLSAL